MADPASEPATASNEPSPLTDLVAMMARLRTDCAWKAAQTHRSLARHLLEETYELLDAIESVEPSDAASSSSPAADDEHLREELGDVLLQVYFHSAIAAEAGRFDIEDVARGLMEKLVRRNPHVFGDVHETDPERINATWEAVKADEKQRADVLDGIPLELPALARAAKVVDRLTRSGVTLPSHDPGDRAGADDLGDRLLELVVEANRTGIDPEQALRDAVRRAGG